MIQVVVNLYQPELFVCHCTRHIPLRHFIVYRVIEHGADIAQVYVTRVARRRSPGKELVKALQPVFGYILESERV